MYASFDLFDFSPGCCCFLALPHRERPLSGEIGPRVPTDSFHIAQRISESDEFRAGSAEGLVNEVLQRYVDGGRLVWILFGYVGLWCGHVVSCKERIVFYSLPSAGEDVHRSSCRAVNKGG